MSKQINEVKVEKTAVRNLERGGVRIGMEFEMIVPKMASLPNDRVIDDFSHDEPINSIEEIIQFYANDNDNLTKLDTIQTNLEEQYEEWQQNKVRRDWLNDREEAITDHIVNDQQILSHLRSQITGAPTITKLQRQISLRVADAINKRDALYKQVQAEWIEDHQIDYDEATWLNSLGIKTAKDVMKHQKLEWPFRKPLKLIKLGDRFGDQVGRDVMVGLTYKDIDRSKLVEEGKWIIEPDTSVVGDKKFENEAGLEFISPPLSLPEIEKAIASVKEFAKQNSCYTNDSTGLHMNISVPNYSRENLDYVKLILLMGDQHILNIFDRAKGPALKYCRSALQTLSKHIKDLDDEQGGEYIINVLQKMRKGFDYAASRALQAANVDKYYSVNVQDDYVEFRGPGGDYLNEDLPQYSTENLVKIIRRLALALAASCDPSSHRELYLKKLRALLEPQHIQYYDPEDPANAKMPTKFGTKAPGMKAYVEPVNSSTEKMTTLLSRILTGETTIDRIREALARRKGINK